MQRGNTAILIIVGILVLVGVAGGAYFLGRQTLSLRGVSETSNAAILPTSSPAPNVSPVSSDADETANWKTYTNINGNYSIKFPSNWYSEEVKDKDIPVFKLSPSPSGLHDYTQVITIYVLDNPKNLTVEEFNLEGVTIIGPGGETSKLQYTYTSVIVGGLEGKRNTDMPGQFEHDTVFIKKDKKIYGINWIKGPGESIPLTTFNQILSTFKFLP